HRRPARGAPADLPGQDERGAGVRDPRVARAPAARGARPARVHQGPARGQARPRPRALEEVMSRTRVAVVGVGHLGRHHARIVALADRRGALLQVGHIERFNPALSALEALPMRPKYIAAERLSSYTFRSTDIGVVLDLMIHDIDLVLSMVATPVRSVAAVGV